MVFPLPAYLTGVAVPWDDGGDEGGHPHRVGAGVGVVPVELDQVVDGQPDADDVHEDPEEVDDVVTEGPLHQGARGLARLVVDVGGHGPAQEGRAEVDGDAGKPSNGDVVSMRHFGNELNSNWSVIAMRLKCSVKKRCWLWKIMLLSEWEWG